MASWAICFDCGSEIADPEMDGMIAIRGEAYVIVCVTGCAPVAVKMPVHEYNCVCAICFANNTEFWKKARNW